MVEHKTEVQQYLNKPYARVILPDVQTGLFSGQILEFDGCFAEGESHAEAYANLESAAEGWIESALARGLRIPEPLAAHGFAGAVALRLSKGLHRRAATFAQREGVSLNQFIVSALAARVGGEDLADKLATRLDARFDELLSMFAQTGRRVTRITTETVLGGEAFTSNAIDPTHLLQNQGMKPPIFSLPSLAGFDPSKVYAIQGGKSSGEGANEDA